MASDTPTPERVEDEFTTIEFVGRDTAFKRFERGLAIAEIVRLRAERARLNEIAEGWRVKSETYASERDMARGEIELMRSLMTAKTPHPGAPRDGE